MAFNLFNKARIRRRNRWKFAIAAHADTMFDKTFAKANYKSIDQSHTSAFQINIMNQYKRQT